MAAALVGVVLLAGIGLSRIEVRHSELISPDGRFSAISSRRWIVGLIPSMPGQGSDSSGSISIYDRQTGEHLGRRPVDMVSFLVDIQWSEKEAWIPAVARWDLTAVQRPDVMSRDQR